MLISTLTKNETLKLTFIISKIINLYCKRLSKQLKFRIDMKKKLANKVFVIKTLKQKFMQLITFLINNIFQQKFVIDLRN